MIKAEAFPSSPTPCTPEASADPNLLSGPLQAPMAAPSAPVPSLGAGVDANGASMGADDQAASAASTPTSRAGDASPLSSLSLGSASLNSSASPSSYEPVEAEAGHIYQPGTKAEVRLVYRIKKGPGAGRHQKSFSISRYGVQGAWEQAEAARQFINANGTLPPHFVVASLPSRNSPSSSGSGQKHRRAASCAASSPTSSPSGSTSPPPSGVSSNPAAAVGAVATTPPCGAAGSARSPRGPGRLPGSVARAAGAAAARIPEAPGDRKRGTGAGAGSAPSEESREEAGTSANGRGPRGRGASTRCAPLNGANAATPRAVPPTGQHANIAVGAVPAGLHAGGPQAAAPGRPRVVPGNVRVVPGAPGAVHGVSLFPATIVSGAPGGVAGVVGTPGWSANTVRGPGGNLITVEEHQRLAAVAGANGAAVINPLNPSPALFGLFPGFVAPQAAAGNGTGDAKGAAAAIPASGTSGAPAAGAVVPATGVRALAAAGLPGGPVNNPALGIVGGGLRGNFLLSSVPASHASFLPRENGGAEGGGASPASGEGGAQGAKEGEQRTLPEGCFRLLLPFGALSRTFFSPATAVAAGGSAAEDVSTPSAANTGPGSLVGGQLHAVPGLGKGVVFHPQSAASPSSFSTSASSPSVGKGKGHPVLLPGAYPQPGLVALPSGAPLASGALGAGGSPTCSSSTSAGGSSTVDEETQSRNGRGGSESSSSTGSSPVSSRGVGGVAGVGVVADMNGQGEEGMKTEGEGAEYVGVGCQAGTSLDLIVKDEAGVASEREAGEASGFGIEVDCSMHGDDMYGEAGPRDGEKRARRREEESFVTGAQSGVSGRGVGGEEESNIGGGGRSATGVRRRRSTSYSRSRAGNPSWLFSLVDCPDNVCGAPEGEEGAASFTRELRDRDEGKDDDDGEGLLSRGESREGFFRTRNWQFSPSSSMSSSSLNSALFASGAGLAGSSFLSSPPPSPPVSPPVRCRPGFLISSPSNGGIGRALKRRCVDFSPLLLASPSTLFASGLGSAERKRWTAEARGAGLLEDLQGPSSTSSSPLGVRPCPLSPRPHAAGDKAQGGPAGSASPSLAGRSRPYGNVLSSPPLENKKAAASLCFSALPPSLTSLRHGESFGEKRRTSGAEGAQAGDDAESQNPPLGRDERKKMRDSVAAGAGGERRDEESEDEEAAGPAGARRGRSEEGARVEGEGERDSDRFSLLPRRHNASEGDSKDEVASGLSSRTKSVLAYLSSPLSDLLASPVFPILGARGEKDKSRRRRGPAQSSSGPEAGLGGSLAGLASSVGGSPTLSPSPSAFLPFSPFSVPPRPSPPCGPSTFPMPLGSPSSPRRRSSGTGRRLVLLPQSSLSSSSGPLETGTPQLFSNALPPVFSENLSVSPACFALASPSVTSSLLPPAAATGAAPRPPQVERVHADSDTFLGLSQPLDATQGSDVRPAVAAPGAPPEGLFQASTGQPLAPALPVLDLGGASAALQAAAKAAAAASAASAATGSRHAVGQETGKASQEGPSDGAELVALRPAVPGWPAGGASGVAEAKKDAKGSQGGEESREDILKTAVATEEETQVRGRGEGANENPEKALVMMRAGPFAEGRETGATSLGAMPDPRTGEKRQDDGSSRAAAAQGRQDGAEAKSPSGTHAKKETPAGGDTSAPTAGVSVVASGSADPPHVSVAAGVLA
ncbi:AP2 domain transcription factor AP2XII-8 [Toxoplasma gondii ME49]|uniref:AP2 domain transcription factor AP2XII-8 n=1 Tax=Toxoplasma gondii (strain ATCC 50611 / Me49) TaxID=508771 RepID=S8ESC0_TOXGM|nr:AP2 domain transcription factor AP2XII-8 [Toxoplasma gondii ME49]EPT25187.1 AP2 domain transcription factor AP2XII-8 [Toxoplasma gondii ME49]|eukprot:XP_002367362.1 AP2 domain transcription factor AP2XII-8 [Toxoplasma gondii ME49]